MTTRSERFVRSRWAAVGAAVAVTLGAGGAMGIARASTPSTVTPALTTITPCRLLDTRPSPLTVGPRGAALGPGETYVATVGGTNGNCTLPTDLTGVVMNVTVVDGTAGSFLTVFPSDQPRPLSSNLNWVAGQAATPNQVTANLSADGKISFYNLAGTVNVIADVVGYLSDHHHDDEYATPVWAAVSGTGNLLGGSHAVSVSRTGALFKVNFDRDVSACAYSALAQDSGGATPGLVMIVPPGSNPDPDSVGVLTLGVGGPTNLPFYLTVTC